MTTQAQKTIYRFIRVPELTHQSANTVVLIKQQPETTIARVQKINNHQQDQSQQQVVKVTENSNNNEKKIKTRVSTCIRCS